MIRQPKGVVAPIAIAGVAFVVMTSACRRKDDAVPDPHARSAPAASGAPSTVQVTAKDAAPPASGNLVVKDMPRDLVGGSTKGTIACGASRCTAEKETCVGKDGRWRCVPSEQAGNTPSDESFACDDASDCTSIPDQTCCVSSGFRRERAACGYKNAVDSEPCGLELCAVGEGAAPCPRGQKCVNGACQAGAGVRATCTSAATHCPADAPVCRFEGGVGTCITNEAAAPLRKEIQENGAKGKQSVLGCTKPSDCGPGMACCSDRDLAMLTDSTGEVAVTECRRACDGTIFEDVCEKSSDCPIFFATGMNGGARKQVCKPRNKSARFPGWMGTCVSP